MEDIRSAFAERTVKRLAVMNLALSVALIVHAVLYRRSKHAAE